LVANMDKEDMSYPIHLGVTEAGDGEDGRVKSAVGIGTLLSEGIGDTIRVSLSEAPENEIPVGKKLVAHVQRMSSAPHIDGKFAEGYDPISPMIRKSKAVNLNNGIAVGGDSVPVAVGVDIEECDLVPEIRVLASSSSNAPGEIKAEFHNMLRSDDGSPAIIKLSYAPDKSFEDITIEASADIGAILLAGFGDGIWIDAPHIDKDLIRSLSLAILQAVRLRISKTEYIACPGCGRTLFDLQESLRKVREQTSHLAGLKIAVMGCIVNGPGEMADADYGYVGAAKGNVSLYKGKECVVKNIPSEDALPLLIQLIKDNGDWTDAPE
ncbi:MAG: flavodoxin-dependent (E)-4-hydroxy-3-methylbut-2-enyl-diphosphate synthase, partial [Muribaculaceae bacterium]|nr:flavodoxin-dependent (E)-4-hydroxy-3-methylbut-2-enyl-diphosphate synthase [Muribaculaceae bacterium]